MNLLPIWIVVLLLCSCRTTSRNSFALAARYGTPASYQHLGEYLRLNYGSEAAGCQVIVLVDQAQRVAAWASSGNHCVKGGIGHKDVLE